MGTDDELRTRGSGLTQGHGREQETRDNQNGRTDRDGGEDEGVTDGQREEMESKTSHMWTKLQNKTGNIKTKNTNYGKTLMARCNGHRMIDSM